LLIIANNCIQTATCKKDENINFPVSNALNNHIKKVARSLSNTLVIELTSDNFDTLVIFGTNANMISLYENDILIDEKIFLNSSSQATLQTDLIKSRNYIYANSTTIDATNKVFKITFTTYPDQKLEVGLIYTGISKKYGLVLDDTSDDIIENSIEHISSNGSLLIVPKPFSINKNYSIKATKTEYITLLQLLEQKRASNDVMMVIIDSAINSGLDNFNNLKFGYLKTPTNIQILPNYITFNCELKESN
jgi:hypothetical protein